MTIRSFLFNREPFWRENRQGMRQKLPDNVQSWTYESESLTQRLRNYYSDPIVVKILLQRWQHPFLSERRLLRQPEHRFSLTREVLLYAGDKQFILARTIIPASTVKAAQNNLSRLGNRPLGEIIFSYPKLERIAMDVTLVGLSDWTRAAISEAKIDQPIWGRRTVYAIAQHQMLVSEFFLPEVLKK